MIISQRLSEACIDIDGVLCRDPYPYQNANHELYVKFLREVEPLFQTDVKLGVVVSARLEKYRPIVQDWLSRNGFKYERLVLLDFPDERTRDMHGLQYSINYKFKVLKESGFNYFIESNLSIASGLKTLDPGIEVFCTDVNRFL